MYIFNVIMIRFIVVSNGPISVTQHGRIRLICENKAIKLFGSHFIFCRQAKKYVLLKIIDNPFLCVLSSISEEKLIH